MPTSLTFDTDVLIVGAGPVGLALAIELGRRGVATLAVEQNDRVGTQPRAKTTNVRTMEHMRRWGIADAIRRASPLPATHPTDVVFATRLFGDPLGCIENAFNGDRTRNPLYSEAAQWIPQYTVETVMRDHALTLPSVGLRFGARLERFTRTADAVEAEVTELATGATSRIRARWLVGADGARSRVRKALGIAMQGEHAYARNHNMVLRMPGLLGRHPQRPAIMYWLVNADSPAIMGPMDDGDRWHFTTQLPAGVEEIDEAEARRRVVAAVGREVPFEILSSDRWQAHRLMADRYSDGPRVFLAGDACHVHPPFGGYGMNMGIADAVDLGWKLAATVQGWGGAELMASYEAERRPIHRRVIDEAVENYALLSNHMVTDDLERPGPIGEAARERAGRAIVTNKRREFKTLGVVLGGRFTDSPLVVGDGSEPPAQEVHTHRPTAHPGCLAPHLWLEDGSSLYDRFGDGYTLLVTRPDDGPGHGQDVERLTAAARDRRLPLTVLEPGDSRLAGLYGARLALIRPDQHVAWRGDRIDGDPLALIDRVRGAAPTGSGDTP